MIHGMHRNAFLAAFSPRFGAHGEDDGSVCVWMVEKRKQEDGARPEADRLKRDGTSDCYEPEVDRLMH